MEIAKFADHYRAVNNKLHQCSAALKDAMWYLDYAEGDEDAAIVRAEKAENDLSIIREEKHRLSTLVDKARIAHRLKYGDEISFDFEWEFSSRSMSVSQKVADIINS